MLRVLAGRRETDDWGRIRRGLDRAPDAWLRLPCLKLDQNTRRYGASTLGAYSCLQGKSAELGFAEVPSLSWTTWCLNSHEAGLKSAPAFHQITGEFNLRETKMFPHTSSHYNWLRRADRVGRDKRPISALHHRGGGQSPLGGRPPRWPPGG